MASKKIKTSRQLADELVGSLEDETLIALHAKAHVAVHYKGQTNKTVKALLAGAERELKKRGFKYEVKEVGDDGDHT